MNLYLIAQDENTGYDTYDSAVVCAESEDDARQIHPFFRNPEWDTFSWCSSPEHVEVKFLGVADPSIQRGVICASYNAG